MTSILSLLLIFSTTFVVWRKVLNQALIGEGPTYFVEPYVSMVEKGGLKELWGRHDAQALLFFHYVRDIFEDNMKLYMIVLILGAGFVASIVYLLIKKITTNNLFAILGSILVVSNFVGSFEILGLGYYQWFIQRVPNFGIALLGFIFLIDYFKKEKLRYFVGSVLLYVTAVFLARYTIHALPLFVSYIFLNSIKFSKKILLSAPFLLCSIVLIKAQSLVDTNSFVDFAGQLQMIPKVFYQVTFLTFPFLSVLPKYLLPAVIKFGTPVFIIFYVLSAFYVIRKKVKLLPIVLTLLISIFFSVYLSIFLNPYFADFFDTSRYLYYTSILISLYWTIVIYFLIKDKSVSKIACYLFVLLWFIFNTNMIHRNIGFWQERHDPVVATIEYVSKNKDFIKDGSYLVVPSQLGSYGTGMLDYFYRGKMLKFAPDLDYESKPKHYTHLIYDASLHTITRKDF